MSLIIAAMLWRPLASLGGRVVVSLIASAILIAGCQLDPAPSTDILFFDNRGGPDYTVAVNGHQALDVPCDRGGALSPGIAGMPSLPWDIVVDRQGQPIYSAHVDHLPGYYVQIGDSVLGVNYSPVLGPVGPSCPPEASSALTLPGPEPSAAPTVAAIDLPNPGGTCHADNLLQTASSVSLYEMSTVLSRHVVVIQRLRNAGPPCVLAQPTVIGLGSDHESITPISVPNLGHTACVNSACHDVYPATVKLATGDSFGLWLNASWLQPDMTMTPPPPTHCDAPLRDVSRAVVPTASGTIDFDWTIVLAWVCPAPASVSLGIRFE